MNHLPTQLAFHEYVMVLRVPGGPTAFKIITYLRLSIGEIGFAFLREYYKGQESKGRYSNNKVKLLIN